MAAVVPKAAPAPTLALELDEPHAAWKITVGLPVGATLLELWRISQQTGHLAHVRGWVARDVTGQATALAPLGVPVTYYARATVAGRASDVGQAGPVTLDDARDWLVDLARPTNTFPVLVEALPALDYDGPTGVHRVLERRDPVLTTSTLWTPTGTLSLVTGTREERDRARAILGAGVAVLLRTPPEEGVGNLYLGVVRVTEQRLSRFALHDDRRFLVDVVQVARPDPSTFVPLAPLTYTQRLAEWPTYRDVVDTGLSYQELAYTFPAGAITPGGLPWLPDDV
jgi:hypothetical protein